MDHISSPQMPFQPVKVPWLGGEGYDFRGFFGFDDRRGWNLSSLFAGNLDDATNRDSYNSFSRGAKWQKESLSKNVSWTFDKLGMFLQTWLFFGMLSEVLERKTVPSRYTYVENYSDGSRQFLITTKNLPDDLASWRQRIGAKSANERETSLRSAVACLDDVATTLLQIAKFEVLHAPQKLLPDEVYLSLAVLALTLDWCSQRIFGLGSERTFATATSQLRCVFLESRMIVLGWCPSHIFELYNRVSLSGLYYMSLLGPRVTARKHVKCTKEDCLMNHVPDDEYVRMHVMEGCACGDFSIDMGKVVTILEDGKFPVISLLDRSGLLEVDVVEYREPMRYVAISHVWSDGFGNPHHNRLTECQITMLSSRIAETVGNNSKEFACHLWIDTLCVPLTPRASRDAAIKAMRTIYEAAEIVLVLDAELLAANSYGTYEEPLMRISSSNWLRRLWTLQEAIFARKLVFQFADKGLDVTPLLELSHRDSSNELYNMIGLKSTLFHRPFTQMMRTSAYSDGARFSMLWSVLQFRSTSKARDEPLCVAAILGLDIGQLLETPDDRKMQLFWSMLRSIPPDILFQSGPRLPDEGHRWAPSSLLEKATLKIFFKECQHQGHQAPEGLMVEGFPCFLLYDAWTPALDKSCFRFLNTADHKWYCVSRSFKNWTPSWRDVGLSDRSEPAIILQRPVTSQNWVSGVIVSIRRKEKRTYFADYLCLVSVFLEGGYYDSLLGEEKGTNMEWGYTSYGEPVPATQGWCVG